MAAKSPLCAFVCMLAIAPALPGCAQNNAGTTGSIVSSFDPGSTANRFRSSGARETTLADFCRHPPQARSPEGSEAIKASCQRIVLDKVGDAALFDKGDGVYHVVFKRPIRNGDICPKGTTPSSICGNFGEGDKMNTSRIDAG
jgi:hypothetical protein